MQKKELVLVTVLVVLAGAYVHFFTHWFEKRQIGIAASLRPDRRGSQAPMVIFTLDGAYRLTHLKVIPLDGNTYNPKAVAVWDLASDSNSTPVKAIRYGAPIRGMKPVLKGARPGALTPGTAYRLLLQAGNVTGSRDFRMQSFGDGS